jgi:hypothetical protein
MAIVRIEIIGKECFMMRAGIAVRSWRSRVNIGT